MIRVRKLGISILFLLISFSGFTQSITDLRSQKAETSKEIEYTTRLLQENSKSEKSSLNQLNLLTSQIRKRNSLISTINSEISVYDECIANNQLSIDILENDLKDLRDEYAQMIRMAYRNKNSLDIVLFLLSAENFNQAYRRLLYLQRYTENRKMQAETIASVQEVLNENKLRLEEQKVTKKELVAETLNERTQLSRSQTRQNSELQKLQDQKRDLQKKLREQRQIEQELENEIQRIIEEEARKNNKGGSGFALTPEEELIGNNFEMNKQRIPWPVERGVIVERFGVHQHPVLTNVQVRNNGINIATEIGAKARAVFNGEVSRVFGISGGNTAIIIRHGNFLSVYSNLKEVTVKAGDKVTTKQNIGTVFTDYDDSNKTILKFQIWRENQKLDPEDWIVR